MEYKEEVLSDERLYVKKGKDFIKDNFKHEIYMVISEDKQNVLITGCSHKGIRNIVD